MDKIKKLLQDIEKEVISLEQRWLSSVRLQHSDNGRATFFCILSFVLTAALTASWVFFLRR